MKLRSRLALIAALAVAVAVGISSLAGYSSAQRELLGEIDASLVERAEAIAQSPFALEFEVRRNTRRPPRGPADPLGRGGVGFDALYFQIIDDDETRSVPFGQDVVLPIEQADRDVIDGHSTQALHTVEVEGDRFRVISVPFGDVTLQLARSLQEADATLGGLARAQWITGILGIAAAAGIGLVISRSALRPVAKLTDAAEHVAETQELAARIDIDREDEVGRLANSFNAMLAALEESKAQQHRLVRDASHELRTPLTAVRTNIEVLARADAMPEETRREVLADLTTEVEELTMLVNELVQLATDTRADEPVTTGLRLDRLVESVAERYRHRTGRTIEVASQEVSVDGRSAQLERAVGNLLDNAAKWSPDDATIGVTVRDGTVTVVDAGPGIPPEDRQRIFDRFYRAKVATNIPGSGLGLAIVKQIVEDHDGEVFVEDAPSGGAAVGFRL